MFHLDSKRGRKTPKAKGLKGMLALADKKNPNLIKPGVDWHEERTLKGVRDYVQKVTGQECTLPQHCIEDVYSMYVNDDVKRAPSHKGNEVKQKLLDSTYNSFSKVLTKNSQLFSNILTREISVFMQQLQDQIEQENQQQKGGDHESPFDVGDDPGEGEGEGQPGEDEGQGSGQGEGGEGENDTENEGEENEGGSNGKGGASHDSVPDTKSDQFDKAMDKNKDKLDQAINRAEKKMEELKEQLGEEALEELSKGDPSFLDTADRLKSELKKLALNKENIRECLKKILDKSESYFSLKYHEKEESIFDADELDDLDGLELLHPVFRNTQLLDVVNKTRQYEGKLDLYLDCSGSMSSHVKVGTGSMSLADLTKGIAIVLLRMKMIDKLYFFDSSLYEIKEVNEFTILSFSRSGGTDFDNVVRQATANGRNSVVITDGEDSVSTYIKNVFWVGVGGTRFQSRWGSGQAFQLYRKNNQCVTFEPNSQKFIDVK